MANTATNELETLLQRYETSLRTWGSLRGDPGPANAEFDRGEALFARIAGIDGGRAGVKTLIDDPDEWVQARVATHLLFWGDPDGVRTLEVIERTSTSLCQVSAKYALRSYASGKLKVNGKRLQPRSPRN